MHDRGCRQSRLFVVLPYFNEERLLPDTLAALAAQSDPDFCLALVDCEHRPHTRVAEDAVRAHPGLCAHRVTEPQKGTGAASDTGFRYAIAQNARWIARTDADCLPDRDWIRNLRRALAEDGLEFVAGRMRPRKDEPAAPWIDRLMLPAMIRLAEIYVRVARRGPQYLYPCFLVPGNNLAITAELYLRSGGFPRTRLEEAYEDRVLGERVRTLTSRAARRPEIVVYNSARRVRAYGYLNTLRWYRNHGYRPAVVDIR